MIGRAQKPRCRPGPVAFTDLNRNKEILAGIRSMIMSFTFSRETRNAFECALKDPHASNEILDLLESKLAAIPGSEKVVAEKIKKLQEGVKKADIKLL